jgi:hypothetical protein
MSQGYDLVGLAPIGSVTLLAHVHDTASATAAPWYDAPLNLGQCSCASALDGPSRPPDTGRGDVGPPLF